MNEWELSMDQKYEFDKLCQTVYGLDPKELDLGTYEDAMQFFLLGLNYDKDKA